MSIQSRGTRITLIKDAVAGNSLRKEENESIQRVLLIIED